MKAPYREFTYELVPFAYAQTTVRVYPNNRSRIPKQPFEYTQKLLLNFLVEHLRGTSLTLNLYVIIKNSIDLSEIGDYLRLGSNTILAILGSYKNQ